EEITRGGTRTESSLSLGEVKSISVETIVNDALSRRLHDVLVERLRASDRFTLSQRRDDADAILKVRATNNSEPASSRFEVQLINARGRVIWSFKGKGYSASTVEQVGNQIVKDLVRRR